MPTAKFLKLHKVPAIFARSINYVEPSSSSKTSIHKSTGRSLSEKRQQNLVSYIAI